MQIQTEIQIQASPAEVWEVFSDFASYPSWNPFVKSLTGNVMEGETIRAELPGMTFKPKVLSFTAPRQLIWQGHLFVKGLFDGKHSFELVDNGDGSTTFLHGESFKGILLPLFKGMLEKETKPGFEAMNRALKERVEEGETNL